MEDMQHQVMGYDRAATMFAPDGHILQVEYAEKTIRLGSASIGLVCKDGVVIVSDRRQKDKLVVEESTNKLHEIDEHIMAVAAGIISDSRVLIDKARTMAQQHRVTYGSEPATESIVRGIADVKQQFTQYGGARPFGVSLMIGGYNNKPVLYATEVTGNYLKYHAFAIGENDELIKQKLREGYKEGMTIQAGIEFALTIFEEIQEKEFDKTRFDIGILDSKKKLIKKTGKDF